MHWQVDESGDGVEVWGTATVHTDPDTKRRLWTGRVHLQPRRLRPRRPRVAATTASWPSGPDAALALKQYGMAGRDTWRRT